MSRPPTLLDKADSAGLRTEPFPYLVIRNALDDDYYQQLVDQLPGIDRLDRNRLNGNNRRIDLISSSGPAALPADGISDTWRGFLETHSSASFVDQSISLFGNHIPDCSERLYQEVRAPEWKRSLYRRRQKNNSSALYRALQPAMGIGPTKWLNDFSDPHNLDVEGRTTFALNTPVREISAVRGPHVDSQHKLYVGLFYLRHPQDESNGGDLRLYRWKPGKMQQRWQGKISEDDVEEIEVIPYQPNTYIIFLNTDDAIHGVSPRSVSSVPRYLSVTSGWFASAPIRNA